MKKLAILLVLVFLTGNAWGITWTKDWSAADDGVTTFGGNDLKNMQDDIDSQSMSSTGDLTLTGDNTYSGDNTFSGNVTFSSIPAMITSQQTFNGEISVTPECTHVGSFTRVMSDAAGDVSYTGVGFKPKAIVFFGARSDAFASCAFWGMDDGVTRWQIFDDDVNGEDTLAGFEGYSIYIQQAAGGKIATASIKSFDEDGFTLTWATTAGIAGTETIKYIAFRM